MKKPRNFVTVIIKKRRAQGIQEPTPLPDDKQPEKLPTMFADGLGRKIDAKPKGKMGLWKS